MSADELERYHEWYLELMPQRLLDLQAAVTSSSEVGEWKADRSSGSIKTLGIWLASQVETRQRTSEEVNRIKAEANFEIEVSDEDLTDRTFSLAVDVGMYLGESLRSQYAHLKWVQALENKKLADFGQMVLYGFGLQFLNPVRVATTFCYGVRKKRNGYRPLVEIFEYWSRLALLNEP